VRSCERYHSKGFPEHVAVSADVGVSGCVAGHILVWGKRFLASLPTRRSGRWTSGGRKDPYLLHSRRPVNWDYAPDGINDISGKPFDQDEDVFVGRGEHRIGKTYRKALYREYTDESFSELKQRPKDQNYLGTLGPLIRAEVGDTIKVHFKNDTDFPASMHPHGVFYKKDSEGAPLPRRHFR